VTTTLPAPKTADERLADAVAQFRSDPLGFVLFAFPWGEPGSELADQDGPDEWQREFLEEIGRQVRERAFDGKSPVDPMAAAVSSGHGIGKSTMVGWLVCWLMSTRPDSQGTVTANTATQVATKTWPKIQQWMKLCITRPWFRVTSERVLSAVRPETWFCSAQTCKEENSDAFQGQHAATSTSWYIFDEASGIPEKIWEAAEGGMTDGEPMIFAFGNCLRNTGKFYRAVFGADKGDWMHRVVDSRRSRFSNKKTLERWIERYGENSDFAKVRIYGQPPEASELQYIDWGRIREAIARPTPMVFDDEPIIAGADFSGGGNAWNVVRFRRGLDGRVRPAVRIPGEKTRLDRGFFTGVLAEILRDRRPGHRVAMMFCDSAFGAPYVERLRALGFDNVEEINFGGPSPDRHQLNMRAHMHYKAKEWLVHGAIDDDDLLPYQLALPGYHLNQKNQLVIESKEDIIDRGEASPDDSDSFCLTFAHAVAPVEPEQPTDEDEFGSSFIGASRGGGDWAGR
jgi:hypothetical protein